MAEWSRRFYESRVERWGDEMGDPFPPTHRHTFRDPGTYGYALGTDPGSIGVVEVQQRRAG